MGHEIVATDNPVYAVAHNGDDVWHMATIHPGCRVETGQPNLETFATHEEAINRIPEEYRPESGNAI